MTSPSDPHRFHDFILTTKISIPIAQPNLIDRPRLIDLLNDSEAGHKLVIIKGPAGFGKTTLLKQWLKATPCPAAWVSLNEEDNAPLNFLIYCIAALQRAQPSLQGDPILHRLTSPEPFSIDQILITLINQLSSLQGRTVLVLDDYHVIQEPVIHELLNRFVTYLPDSILLVITTRTDPPLALTQLRAKGEVIEVREHDLRFTTNEILAYMSEVTRLGLSEAEIDLLEARTQGWIAALQMAALSLRGQSPTTIERLTGMLKGESTLIADYLAEEVFLRQPPDIQRFLLETSILDRLCVPLCSALFGDQLSPVETQARLEYLEHSSLFTTVLDQERLWYGYHPLFAEFLCKRLLKTYPDDLPILHSAASLWYEQQGFTNSAIDHALAAQDFKRAAKLIGKTASDMIWQGLVSANVYIGFGLIEHATQMLLMRGELSILLGWLEALPESVLDSSPRLHLSYAWVLLLIGKLDACERHIEKAESIYRTRSRNNLRPLGQARALRGTLAMVRGNFEESAVLAQQALEHLDAEDEYVRGLVALNLGVLHLASGSPNEARAALGQVKSSNNNTFLPVAVASQIKLAEVRVRQARLQQAASLYHEVLRTYDQNHQSISRVLGMTFLGLAQIFYEWDHLESAQKYVEQGIQLCQQWQDSEALLLGWLTLARILDAWNDAVGAREALENAEHTPHCEMGLKRLSTRNASAWARLQMKYRDSSTWLAQQASDLSRSGQVMLARYLLETDRLGESRHMLDPLLRAAEASGRVEATIQFLVMQAQSLRLEGYTSRAAQRLSMALALAEPSGYIRIFTDEEGMGNLLQKILTDLLASPKTTNLPTQPYVSRLLLTVDAAGFAKAPAQLTSQISREVIKSLSRKEREVLNHLAAGKSNLQLAEIMGISPGTVKRHLHNIYKKIGVSSRTEAIAKIMRSEK